MRRSRSANDWRLAADDSVKPVNFLNPPSNNIFTRSSAIDTSWLTREPAVRRYEIVPLVPEMPPRSDTTLKQPPAPRPRGRPPRQAPAIDYEDRPPIVRIESRRPAAAPKDEDYSASTRLRKTTLRYPLAGPEQDELIRNPVRFPQLAYTSDEERAAAARREATILQLFGLGPHCTNIEDICKYIALHSRVDSFETHASHVSSLASHGQQVSPLGVAKDAVLRFLNNKPLAPASTNTRQSAIRYFQECLNLVNDEALFAKRICQGLAYFHTTGSSKVRGAITRDILKEIFTTAYFTGVENEIFRDGMTFVCAFGFRNRDVRRLVPESFLPDQDKEGADIFRYTGSTVKSKGQTKTIVCIPAWTEEIRALISKYRRRPQLPADSDDDFYHSTDSDSEEK